MAKSISLDLRQRVVDAYQQGKGTIEEVALRFSVSPKSVTRWVALVRYGEDLNALPASGGQGRLKISPQHEDALLAWLDEDSGLYNRELAELLLINFGLKISPSHISRVLKRLGYTRKKNTHRYEATTA